VHEVHGVKECAGQVLFGERRGSAQARSHGPLPVWSHKAHRYSGCIIPGGEMGLHGCAAQMRTVRLCDIILSNGPRKTAMSKTLGLLDVVWRFLR
jgi:hypothetical protein